jgi:peptidoglycan/LPS O-acetylase OafA/YrhL
MGTVRFLLALSIALSHFGGPFTLFNSRYAVQVFYVVSGFLISMILREKYGTRLWLFYSNRAARILIPYWIVLVPTTALCVWKHVGFWAYTSSVSGSFDLFTATYVVTTNVFIVGQDIGLFLGWSAGSQLYFTSQFNQSSTAVWAL